jgi:hypothetical protein
MKYVSNKEKAIAHIASLQLDDELKAHLQAVVSKHAVDNCTVEVSVDDENVTLLFQADHDLDGSAMLTGYVVIYTTVDKTTTVTALTTVSIQGNTMNTQENTLANESTTATADAPEYSKEEREALLAKIAAYEKAAGVNSEKPAQAAKPATAKSAKETELATKIGKGVLYTVGAVAVVTGGFFAWKKWGPGSSAS